MNGIARHAGSLGRATRIGWLAFAVALLLAPWIFRSSLALTLLSQITIAIVACLSFNLLLGQGGMLSFGHAVYSGLGAYAAVHVLKAAGAGAPWIPVSLIPLVGGAAGLVVAALLGFVATRQSGTAFAMITLGLGELVAALAMMLPQLSGGEAGVSANRVVGSPVLGLSFGPQSQVYGLLAVYAFGCSLAMFGFTRTPLGRLLNAVRDNPERVDFTGHDPRQVRWLAFCIAGFFAGVAGGMFVLNTEIVTPEVLGAARSGAYLLFTVLGGVTVFFGPVIGAVLMVGATLWLATLTPAWLLYLGLLFMLTVMLAPGGVAGLIVANARLDGLRYLRRNPRPGAALALSGALLLAGSTALIELVYRRQLDNAPGAVRQLAGFGLDPSAWSSWLIAAGAVASGATGWWFARRVAAANEARA